MADTPSPPQPPHPHPHSHGGGGDPPETVESVVAAQLKAQPDVSVDQALALALRLQQEDLLDASSEIYRRVLQLVPDHPDAIHFLGLATFRAGNHDEALDLVRKAAVLAPDHLDIQNNLGNILFHMKKLDEAEIAYRAVLRLRPGEAGVHSNLGTVLRRRGNLVDAEVEYKRALEIDPDHGETHHQLGTLYRDLERHQESLTAFQRALQLLPYSGDSYRNVGFALYALGRVDDAATTYRRWLELEPQSPLAPHLLAACTGQAVPDRASDGFVQKTFDSFAESFDTVLARLQYRAPELCATAVAEALGAPAASLDVLDAGAGTGLVGPHLRPYARRLVGVDLSPGMLEKAAARKVYDVLDTGELTAYLRDRPEAFDLVVSADTLCYFGDLTPAAQAAAVALRAGGYLVFTVEHEDDTPAEGHRIHPHGRYSHSKEHVVSVLEAAGMPPVSIDRCHLRTENRKAVEGMLVTARKPSA